MGKKRKTTKARPKAAKPAPPKRSEPEPSASHSEEPEVGRRPLVLSPMVAEIAVAEMLGFDA